MRRMAMVGHGDYAGAVRLIARGEPEPYFGMAYTLRTLEALFADRPYLVVSLNAAPGRERVGRGEAVGLPRGRLPAPVPETVAMVLWARRVVRELERFQPTHVLLRTGGILAWHVLRHCVARRISTLAIFANTFDDPDPKNRFVSRRVARLLNDPCVFLAGNHKHPATASMVRCGLDVRKAAAWDWPGARHPRDWPTKALAPEAAWSLLYVGAMSEAKGVGDLIDAVGLLRRRGRPVRLTAVGTGRDLEALRRRAAALPDGAVTFTGRVGNDEVFRMMRACSAVCVPSRHEFTEGMPMTLTEALASRTPVVASDHPVMAEALVDGTGLRFFRARAPASLAAAVEAVLGHPAEYSRLSASTAEAFARVECTTTFGDLVSRWRRSFEAAAAPARGRREPVAAGLHAHA
ncbi:glycosyltransferase family 4 protein [Anaeromyxobacter sp. PSR-1]|uniref:glycosyltransferase n=1 Tax=unclassified Anaeromyxobacter TaxID=2620896 RepID=UPI0005E356F2|nr:glycosyltransferase family 4 protein [Anaeromyxobacter sp. PSR-1]GAO03668.1 glycogen synthase [Anaeromyxobacter sp. PSR-1]